MSDSGAGGVAELIMHYDPTQHNTVGRLERDRSVRDRPRALFEREMDDMIIGARAAWWRYTLAEGRSPGYPLIGIRTMPQPVQFRPRALF